MMIMAVKEDSGKVAGPQECAGCGKKIHDKFLLKVIMMLIDMMLIMLTSLSVSHPIRRSLSFILSPLFECLDGSAIFRHPGNIEMRCSRVPPAYEPF